MNPIELEGLSSINRSTHGGRKPGALIDLSGSQKVSEADEENEQRVLDLLNHIHRQGRTIVMVTHNPDLGCVADRIIRLQHGKYLNEESRHHVA